MSMISDEIKKDFLKNETVLYSMTIGYTTTLSYWYIFQTQKTVVNGHE
jgi:hypothetical protein